MQAVSLGRLVSKHLLVVRYAIKHLLTPRQEMVVRNRASAIFLGSESYKLCPYTVMNMKLFLHMSLFRSLSAHDKQVIAEGKINVAIVREKASSSLYRSSRILLQFTNCYGKRMQTLPAIGGAIDAVQLECADNALLTSKREEANSASSHNQPATRRCNASNRHIVS